MEDKIITAVSGHPVLYDSSSSHYRDLTERQLAWRTVSKEVGISEEKCRRKWKGLRDTYLRYRKKEQDKRWKHSSALSFLDHYVQPREASGSAGQGDDEDDTAEDEGPRMAQEAPEHGKRRRKRIAAESEKETQLEERLVRCLKRHADVPAPPPSVDELFLKSLAPSLQRLPPQQKECVKFQIHKIIFEAL